MTSQPFLSFSDLPWGDKKNDIYLYWLCKSSWIQGPDMQSIPIIYSNMRKGSLQHSTG